MNTKEFTHEGTAITISIARNTGSIPDNSGSPFLAVTTNTITATVAGIDPFEQEGIADTDIRVRAEQLEADIKKYLDNGAYVNAQLVEAGYADDAEEG